MARESTKALGAIVIIVEGNRGNGFSVQAPEIVVRRLPEMLRNMANQIEASHVEMRRGAVKN